MPRTQTGAVLLVALAVLVLGALTVVVHLVDPQAYRQASERRTAAALAEAKAALIAYAVTYYENETDPGKFGLLPCPDYQAKGAMAEGEPDPQCGSRYAAKLGRLPWEALSVVPTRDGSGECLWYAVSGHYKTSPGAHMMNEDSNGQFDVYSADGTTKLVGDTPDQRAVALVISPGPALGEQDRESLDIGADICGGNYDPAHYLDCLDLDDGGLCDDETSSSINNALLSGSADTIERFVAARRAKDAINDRVVVITREELFEAIRKRRDFADKLYDDEEPPTAEDNLTRWVAECIADYARGNPTSQSLPFAAPVGLNEKDYRLADAYDDEAELLAGRVPYLVDDSNAVNKNDIVHVLRECPPWNEQVDDELTPRAKRYRNHWQHWKDHLFYAVAKAYKPVDALAKSPTCGKDDCLRVNGLGAYAAVVIYSGPRIAGKVRDAPPMDTDTKNDIGNYLEGGNASSHKSASGDGNYESGDTADGVNDVLYCIKAESLTVVPC